MSPRSPHLIFLILSMLALTGCSKEVAHEPVVRPALVTQPEPAADAVETFPGEVRARLEPELAFRIGGKLTRRLVEVGDKVERDQPLAELDPEDVRLQLEAIRAKVVAAEADLELAKTERERFRALLDRQLVSRSQIDNVENKFKAAEARVNQMRAEYNVASNQAGYATLRASQDGVIAARFAEVGQVVTAGQPLFRLAAAGDREVVIGLPENSRERFKLGQQVAVSLWSQPGQYYPGVVREMAPAADSISRTFTAKVAFLDPKAPAELGQSARVFFKADGEVPLSVPLAAVSADNGKAFVYVVDPETSTVRHTPVRIGQFTERGVPVLEGLRATDWVVAAGVQVLRDGQAVRPVDRDNRTVEFATKE